MLSAGPLGIMQSCMDTVLPYVGERTQFGKKIGEFQVQFEDHAVTACLLDGRPFACIHD